MCPSLKGRDDYDNVMIHAQMFQTDPSVMSELGPALVGSSNGVGLRISGCCVHEGRKLLTTAAMPQIVAYGMLCRLLAGLTRLMQLWRLV